MTVVRVIIGVRRQTNVVWIRDLPYVLLPAFSRWLDGTQYDCSLRKIVLSIGEQIPIPMDDLATSTIEDLMQSSRSGVDGMVQLQNENAVNYLRRVCARRRIRLVPL